MATADCGDWLEINTSVEVKMHLKICHLLYFLDWWEDMWVGGRWEDQKWCSRQNHINLIRRKDEEWGGFSAAQRTKEGGNCVEVFKDSDQIVVATTGIPLDLFPGVSPVITGLFYQGCWWRWYVVSWKVVGHLSYDVAHGLKSRSHSCMATTRTK